MPPDPSATSALESVAFSIRSASRPAGRRSGRSAAHQRDRLVAGALEPGEAISPIRFPMCSEGASGRSRSRRHGAPRRSAARGYVSRFVLACTRPRLRAVDGVVTRHARMVTGGDPPRRALHSAGSRRLRGSRSAMGRTRTAGGSRSGSTSPPRPATGRGGARRLRWARLAFVALPAALLALVSLVLRLHDRGRPGPRSRRSRARAREGRLLYARDRTAWSTPAPARRAAGSGSPSARARPVRC